MKNSIDKSGHLEPEAEMLLRDFLRQKGEDPDAFRVNGAQHVHGSSNQRGLKNVKVLNATPEGSIRLKLQPAGNETCREVYMFPLGGNDETSPRDRAERIRDRLAK